MLIDNKPETLNNLGDYHKGQAYNALDCCVTLEIFKALKSKSDRYPLVYNFERAMQGPAFAMATRGICVNEEIAKAESARLKDEEAACAGILNRLAAVFDVATVNAHSPKQVAALLYDACGEAPYHVRNAKTKQMQVSVGEDALTMMQARSPLIGVLAHLILHIRGLRKQASFVNAVRSPDGRIRSSFNVGATTSGRWSFSKNVYKEGTNFGNIPKRSRVIFIPSKSSRVMINVDLKQAESYVNANLCDDWAYIEAHETGDVHTAVALDLFGDQIAPNIDPKVWVKMKNDLFPREMSPRDICKKVTHGTAYGVGERKSSKITGLPIAAISKFRIKFFGKYTGIHARIKGMPERLLEKTEFITALGRKHQFFGHPKDDETVRGALADEPQSIVADVLCIALWRLWRYYDGRILWLLCQNYDSILLECEREDVEKVKEILAWAFNIPIPINGRQVIIPYDVCVGENWKEACG